MISEMMVYACLRTPEREAQHGLRDGGSGHSPRKNDIQNQLLKGGREPVHGRTWLSRTDDRFTGNLKSQVLAAQEARKDVSERLESRRVASFDDDPLESKRRRRLGGKGEVLSVDGPDCERPRS